LLAILWAKGVPFRDEEKQYGGIPEERVSQLDCREADAERWFALLYTLEEKAERDSRTKLLAATH
jgi:hypothetical protein